MPDVLTRAKYGYILLIVNAEMLDPQLCRQIERTCSLANLRKASRSLTLFYDKFFRPLDLYSTQFTLLVALAVAHEAAITPLARELAMDRTTLARNLRPLERQRLVEITPGEDGRKRMVRLTAKGREKVARAIPLWKQAQQSVVQELGERQWRQMLGDLDRLASMTQGE